MRIGISNQEAKKSSLRLKIIRSVNFEKPGDLKSKAKQKTAHNVKKQRQIFLRPKNLQYVVPLPLPFLQTLVHSGP
jgi:hypothetical protein